MLYKSFQLRLPKKHTANLARELMIRYLKPLKWLDHTGGLNKAWQDPLNKIASLYIS